MTTITTIGRITKDFELMTSEKSGCIYANFSLAVNEGFGDKQKAIYFECTVFGSEAERLVKAKAKKGSLIQVTGRFGISEFVRKNGEPGFSLKITIHAWGYIPGTNGERKDNNGGNGESADANSNSDNNENESGTDNGGIATQNPNPNERRGECDCNVTTDHDEDEAF